MFPFALFVEGNWDPMTPRLKNKLIIYFQSKKSNGGDCEVDFQVSDGQRARVRFKTHEVRQNVLDKLWHEIKLDEDILRLNVYLPPTEDELSQETKSSFKRRQTEKLQTTDEIPTSSKSQIKKFEVSKSSEDSKAPSCASAVIKNIQDLNRDFLSMLVKNFFRWNSEEQNFNMVLVPECDFAVVTFTNDKDAERFVQSCPKNSVFKKKNLEVCPLEMTTKVIVKDFPSDINLNCMMQHFHMFGQVDVKMLEDDKSAIITFKTHAEVQTVLSTQHYIKNLPIRVFPHCESLEVAPYVKEELPESFTENIDPSVWEYLRVHQSQMDIIKLHMQAHFCDLDFNLQSVKISPLVSILRQGVQTKSLLQTWREKVSVEFNATMSKYKSLEIKIERDAWAELEPEVRRLLSFEPVTLIHHGGQKTLIMAGLAEDVNRTGIEVQNTVNRIRQKIQRVKKSIKDEISMAPSVYEIIMNDGLQHKICNTFPELKLNYDAPSQKVTFWGLKQDVLESKNTIYQEVVNLNRRMIALDASILQFLIMGDIEKLTKELFLSQGICASMEVKKDQAFIVAKTEKTLQDGEDQLKAQLYHTRLNVDPTQLLSTEWKQLVDKLNHRVNSPMMTMLINQSDRQVVISGFSASVLLVEEQLNDYFKNYNHVSTTFKSERIIMNFMKEHKKSDWCEIGRNNVKVSFGNDTVSLSGPNLQVSKYKIVVENLLSSMSCCSFKLDKPGARKVFKNKEMFIVETIKNKLGCVVQLIEEHDRKQISSSAIGKKRAHTPDEVEIIASNRDFCSYHVDTIVHVANDMLELDSGLSKTLSDAAGPQLQEACKQIIKTRTKLHGGEAVMTEAGHLQCKHVIHAVVPHYGSMNHWEAVSDLKNAVRRSMNLAEREYCQSLALLAVGFSSLGFPLDIYIDNIVSALNEFFQHTNGNTCFQKVYLIDTNEKIIEAFETATQNVFGVRSTTYTNNFGSQQTNPEHPSSSNQASSQGVKTKEGLTITLQKYNIQDTSSDVVVKFIPPDLALNHGASAQAQSSLTSGSAKGPFSKVTSKIGIYETLMGGVVLQVLNGDISKETTDVIVNSTNSNFTLKSGVSLAVLGGAGPDVEAEYLKLGALPNKGLIMTHHGNLQCKKIIHVSATTDLKTIQKRVKQTLEMCAKNNFTSVAFPAFGTGQGGINSVNVADHMLDGVIDFLKQTPQSSLQTVRIVIFQASMLVDFYQSMIRREGDEKPETIDTRSRHSADTKSFCIRLKPKSQQDTDFVFENKPAVCFSICGGSQSAVNETKQFLDKVISEEQASQLINDTMILKLSNKDKQRIWELQKMMDVNVKLEHKPQSSARPDPDEVTIIVEGLSKDVLVVAGEINAMLKATRDEVNLKRSMEKTAELVDWQYQQGGQFHSFDIATNFLLEEAFIQDTQQVEIKYQTQLYKVKMPKGPATSASGGNQMEIRRVDKIRADNLPKEWDVMAPNELHKVCRLQTNSKEYNDVLDHFRKTCHHFVYKIERIQNPRMWKNYQNNKQFMEQKNGHQNNEKLLFHGTREESINQINQHGFNRSYAGKNATAYGKGTYFALNASYSAKKPYSLRNSQGLKQMYFCRVLTGDYTLGNCAMIDSPAKEANGKDFYDTVVDNTTTPTIFVVFRDYHAYPDYLITFT